MSYLYPYGDTQQLNLSWFLAKFKELYDYITNLDPDDIALATVLSRFTNEYNSSTNYIPGDYVIHEGFIYKANRSTTGNFNPQAWDAALPVNDIQGLRILLGGISTDLTDLEQNAVTNLQYTPGAASADGLLRQTKNGAAETVMTVDNEPTANSQNPVKSGAVRAELNAISDAVTDEQNQIDDLNDITGDGSLSGFTATDLTGAANELKGSLNNIETGIAIIVDGDTCQTAIPFGGYAYIKNNTHGLTEGLYTNTSTAVFPTSGGVANSSVFTSAQNALGDIGFGAWVDSNGLRYRKSKRFVEINIYRNFTDGGASPITISAWGIYSLGTIQDFSTNYSIAFPCLYLDSNNSRQLAFISVSTTGEVVITNNSGSGITLKDVMAYNVVITNT